MTIPEDVIAIAESVLIDMGIASTPTNYDAIARAILADREARSGWRDIASAPVEGGFLAANATEVWAAWHYDSDNWHARYGSRGATHWMLLPSPPSDNAAEMNNDACPCCGGSGHYGDAAIRAINGDIPASPSPSQEETETRDASALLLEAEKALEGIVRSCTSSPTPMSEGDTRIVSAPSRDALVAARSTLSKIRGGE